MADEATEKLVHFNTTSVKMVVQDTSNITEIVFEPEEALIQLNQHITVNVRAVDQLGNRNKCKFQVALRGMLYSNCFVDGVFVCSN
jgi:hypothetical protein